MLEKEIFEKFPSIEEIKLFVIPSNIYKISLNLTTNFSSQIFSGLLFVSQHLMSMNGQIDFCFLLGEGNL